MVDFEDGYKMNVANICNMRLPGDLLPKVKKLLHNDMDHGPHSVDTEFTHVILKTP